ncbi:hypothetical protein [Anaerosolibacter sp.]|uniref:hypothetical protein n=1 Tax=Anaerosolibacter sp. TaxID=1872527 RepID=UPI0039F008CD
MKRIIALVLVCVLGGAGWAYWQFHGQVVEDEQEISVITDQEIMVVESTETKENKKPAATMVERVEAVVEGAAEKIREVVKMCII